jgi:hypothetical protein
MIPARGVHICALALLQLLTGIASLPVLAAEDAIEQVIVPVKPGVNALIRRILNDPGTTYDSVQGPDDCSSEALYQGTREVLGDYIAAPGEQQAQLRDFILSGRDPCNCAKALVGTNLDILVGDLGLTMSELPCLQAR